MSAQRKRTKIEQVNVLYDLFDLPTAFHKAGLVGLLLSIQSLKQRRILKEEDVNYELTPSALEIDFTESLLQTLMDDLYDAREVDVAVKNKWQGAKTVREPTPAETEAGNRYVYRVIQPMGNVLCELYPDEDGLWLKMWRDMLWSIPRGRPTTREPYKERAEGKPCKEGPRGWQYLLKVHAARAKGESFVAEISSALLPGAQAANAEGVPFAGRAEENLLLHFWPLTVLLFVPRRVERDGSTDFAGYTVAVPEVSDLGEFIGDFANLLHELSTDAQGYRPAEAVIDIAAEGGLAFFDYLARVTGLSMESGELRFSVAGVEYLHLVKVGNNVKTMAAGRISPNRELLDAYRELVSPDTRRFRVRHPLVRRGLLMALLDDEPWYRPFGEMFSTYQSRIFLRRPRESDETTEKRGRHFATDAATKLSEETSQFVDSLRRIETMPDTERPATPLPVIVNRVVRNYLMDRTGDKSGVKLDNYKAATGEVDYKAVPPEFNETKRKLGESLFLEFRSRKDQAFVDHFAATFFSVRQRLNEGDRLQLADALLNASHAGDTSLRDDLKTLTLLSLSANS